MIVLAIDPGNEHSAWVRYETETKRLLEFAKVSNDDLHTRFGRWASAWVGHGRPPHAVDHLAIEMIASYGMPVGKEVFETCVWIGRLIECWSGPYTLVYRREVKLHLCGSARAKDGNVRAALLDLYGGKEMAVGKKSQPGPLWGVVGDAWSALAVARTWADTRAK